MIAIAGLWVGLALAMIVALSAFTLLLVLARRVRDVEERVKVFFPAIDDGLPIEGTPVPDLTALSCDGLTIDKSSLLGHNQILAFLSTECAVCREQVYVLRGVASNRTPKPIVIVSGPPDDRIDMVSALRECVTVVEEFSGGPVTTAFQLHEFPAILLLDKGEVRIASHGMAAVLESSAASQ